MRTPKLMKGEDVTVHLPSTSLSFGNKTMITGSYKLNKSGLHYESFLQRVCSTEYGNPK